MFSCCERKPLSCLQQKRRRFQGFHFSRGSLIIRGKINGMRFDVFDHHGLRGLAMEVVEKQYQLCDRARDDAKLKRAAGAVRSWFPSTGDLVFET